MKARNRIHVSKFSQDTNDWSLDNFVKSNKEGYVRGLLRYSDEFLQRYSVLHGVTLRHEVYMHYKGVRDTLEAIHRNLGYKPISKHAFRKTYSR